MSFTDLIERYAAGPGELRRGVAGMSAEQLGLAPVPGKWSARQVVCHIADFEPVYADRMKRVIAEERPTFFSGDPDLFAARLAYPQRDVAEELDLIENVRKQMARILRTLSDADFQREGLHSVDGPLSLATLLERITKHIPHHATFLREKRRALGLPE